MSDILTIEGLDIGGLSMYDGLNEIIPGDVMGLDGLGLGRLTELLPNTDELKQAAVAGGGVTAGLLGGLALERLLNQHWPSFPGMLVPPLHVVAGIGLGKLAAGISAPFGVGVAAAFTALAIVRGLQRYLKINVGFAGLADLDDLSGLADLMGDTDLLPDTDMGNVAIETMNGVRAEEVALAGAW